MKNIEYSNSLYQINEILKYMEPNLKARIPKKFISYFENNNGNVTISERFLKPKVEHYNYDYFSNINYTFDLTKEVGNRVTSIKFNGEELSEDKNLTIVMNNYRASGAGGYECYENCKVVKEILIEMPEIIINYFKNNPKVVVDTARYYSILI